MIARSVALASGALVAAVVAVSCGGGPPPEPGARSGLPPAVADPAPGFTLTAADGSDATLRDVASGRPVLFYFSMGPG